MAIMGNRKIPGMQKYFQKKLSKVWFDEFSYILVDERLFYYLTYIIYVYYINF